MKILIKKNEKENASTFQRGVVNGNSVPLLQNRKEVIKAKTTLCLHLYERANHIS